MHCRPSCNTSQASSPEHRIGTRLIERGDVQVQLTPAGLDEARLALAQAERAIERARQATRANPIDGIGISSGSSRQAFSPDSHTAEGMLMDP
jgi:DNA-binding transcriptional LysR family regulator